MEDYFYFWKGDANNWLDRTVKVPKVSSLTLEQWIGAYDRLKKVNDEMLSDKKVAKQRPTSARRKAGT